MTPWTSSLTTEERLTASGGPTNRAIELFALLNRDTGDYTHQLFIYVLSYQSMDLIQFVRLVAFLF